MSVWTARRFWSAATVEARVGGHAVLLDGRPVRTPLKVPMLLPSAGLALEVAAEWQAQGETVNPATMPFTRTANSAIDTVIPQFVTVAAGIAVYGASDLLCYRATDPEGLVQRQARGWDPLLAWAATELGAPLSQTSGIMPVAQPSASLAGLGDRVGALTPFQLAAFHDLVALSGSLVLGLAVASGRLSAAEAWSRSRIDEDWQAELWGVDEDAAVIAALKGEAFLTADRFFALCG